MKIKDIYINATTTEMLEREFAFAVDLIICLTLAIFPKIGWILGSLYFFAKDAIPTTGGRSFGKLLYGLKTVSVSTNQRVQIEKSIIRSLIMLIPILNIVDIISFLKTGTRLADRWIGTKVVKIEEAGEPEV